MAERGSALLQESLEVMERRLKRMEEKLEEIADKLDEEDDDTDDSGMPKWLVSVMSHPVGQKVIAHLTSEEKMAKILNRLSGEDR